ncbi:MAG: hypothetical protein AB9828_06840 [Sphaerochaetaceae bacterium]
MNRKMILISVAVLLMAVTTSLSASAIGETGASTALWNKADTVMDASETYLPGVRQISYQETDGKGNAVYANQAVVLLESLNGGRYIQTREFGDQAIFDLMDRYTDGIVFTPFTDNVYALNTYDTGVTEIVDDKSCEVYNFELAVDKNLFFYDPNYTPSTEVIGWDASEDTTLNYVDKDDFVRRIDDDDSFDGTLSGSVWIDKVSGAVVKLVNSFTFEDNGAKGTLSIEQTVFYDYSNGICTPSLINTNGKLTEKADTLGKVLVTDFTISERQTSFWYNEKFIRGDESL